MHCVRKTMANIHRSKMIHSCEMKTNYPIVCLLWMRNWGTFTLDCFLCHTQIHTKNLRETGRFLNFRLLYKTSVLYMCSKFLSWDSFRYKNAIHISIHMAVNRVCHICGNHLTSQLWGAPVIFLCISTLTFLLALHCSCQPFYSEKTMYMCVICTLKVLKASLAYKLKETI